MTSSNPMSPAIKRAPNIAPTIPASALTMMTKAKKHQNSSREARPEKSAYFFSVDSADPSNFIDDPLERSAAGPA